MSAKVIELSAKLNDMLALASARRLFKEISRQQLIGDDSYHDNIIILARRWVAIYGGEKECTKSLSKS